MRDRAAIDLAGVLAAAAGMGYEGVEFAGLHQHEAREVRRHLDRLGLRASSAHFALDRLTRSLPECVEEAKALGFDLLVVPYLAEEERGAEGYPAAVGRMVEAAKRLRDAGLRLAYHHHAFEFEAIGPDSALRGIDVITDAPADLLLLEVDVFWARHGGVDPVVFLRRHLARTPVVHLKDMRDARSKRFTEIGSGVLKWSEILRTAASRPVEWLIVEQDSDFVEGSSMKSAEKNLAQLRALLAKEFGS